MAAAGIWADVGYAAVGFMYCILYSIISLLLNTVIYSVVFVGVVEMQQNNLYYKDSWVERQAWNLEMSSYTGRVVFYLAAAPHLTGPEEKAGSLTHNTKYWLKGIGTPRDREPRAKSIMYI